MPKKKKIHVPTFLFCFLQRRKRTKQGMIRKIV